ncbi:MAG TPA: hypothetical protein VFD31_05330 [Thermoleophilaceae bacterium]|nr:hypothetical protein [Thermoleophilaceae bacterium]
MRAGGLLAVLVAAIACALFAVPASAGHPQGKAAQMSLIEGGNASVFASAVSAAPPLDGKGQNIDLVANLALDPEAGVPGGANDRDFSSSPAAADLELAGDYAYVGSYSQGLVIVNISSCDDPSQPAKCQPFVQGALPCSGGQFDVQLSPDANIAVVAHESASSSKDCHKGEEGAQIVDISNKSAPREIAFISDHKSDGSASGEVVDGAHNVTLDWPNLYIDNYTPTYPEIDVYSLANPASPAKIGAINFNANGKLGPHDSIPNHRPDGKNLLYAASITKSDVIDISDPTKPRVMQTIIDPQVGISHGAEPNHKRDVLIVTDEYGGGTGVGACGGQQGDATGATPLVPGQAGSAGVGAVHFYRLDPATGLVQRGGTDKAGIFNIPAEANEPAQVADDAGCTSHVFWQAPDQNRFTIAWYGRGTRVVDFSDPAKPRQLGFFVPLGANTWSAKPHRGFIFSGDMARGLDVLRYRGESCDRWPTTSGSAEDQRAETQRGGAGTGKPGSSPTRGPSPRKFTGPCKPFTTAQARAASRRLVISRSTRRSGNRKAPVVVRCRSVKPCRGTLRLRARLAKGKKARRVTVGRRTFGVGAGKRRKLQVKLNRKGRRLVRNNRRLRLYAFAKLRRQAGIATAPNTARGSYRLITPRR